MHSLGRPGYFFTADRHSVIVNRTKLATMCLLRPCLDLVKAVLMRCGANFRNESDKLRWEVILGEIRLIGVFDRLYATGCGEGLRTRLAEMTSGLEKLPEGIVM